MTDQQFQTLLDRLDQMTAILRDISNAVRSTDITAAEIDVTVKGLGSGKR